MLCNFTHIATVDVKELIYDQWLLIIQRRLVITFTVCVITDGRWRCGGCKETMHSVQTTATCHGHVTLLEQ